MIRGFTFGKYYPFHQGHEVLIQFALEQCDEITVLVCASDSENITGETRAEWIRESFPNTLKVKILVLNYSENDLPNTSESSKEVSKLWSEQFKQLVPNMEYLITSEKYGDFVADFMGIKHIPFDPLRNQVPISSTLIRNDLNTNWQFLNSKVKSSLIQKIVLLGTESTGKTTLCSLLAAKFNCDFVEETARAINSQTYECSFKDLEDIAENHAQAIDNVVKASKSPLLIIDTDINITQSYAKFLFQQELIVKTEVKEANKAGLYLFLDNDCEHVQDGTRLNKEDRDQLHWSHLKTLEQNNIKYITVGGDWETRFLKSVQHIQTFIKRSSLDKPF